LKDQKSWENSGQEWTSTSLSKCKNHPHSYFGLGDTKITRRCNCAVWNLEQNLLCVVFGQVSCRIWKCVL